jgi:hypothetical protein
MDRRHFLLTTGAVSAGLGAASGAQAVGATGTAGLRGPYIDLTTGKGNMLAAVRMNANLDESRTKYGSASGLVYGVRPGEAVRDLVGFEVVSAARAWKQADGSYRVLHRETVLYTDADGEVLAEWTNPYTHERVKVVDIVNDPWNETYEEFEPRPPSYGGLNKNTNAPRKPYVLPWREVGDGLACAQTHINLYYPSALQPEKWPRESSGKFNQVSEIFSFIMPLKDMQNESKTSLEYSGGWARITPWLPWMLMGQAPGHVLYESTVSSFDRMDRFKPKVLAYMQKTYPFMLEPPPKESWSKPNLSSLELYAQQQTPAPALKSAP